MTARKLAWMLGVALVLLLLPDRAAANKHLERARRAYENFKYQRVIKHLERAIRIADGPQEELEIYEFLARMYVMYNKDDQAKDAFIEVLKRDPAFTLPETESPKIRTALEVARGESGIEEPEPEPEAPEPLPRETVEAIAAAPPTLVEPSAPRQPAATTPTTTTAVESSSFYQTWWFWTAVGVVVAGGAAATFAITMKPGPPEGVGPYQLP